MKQAGSCLRSQVGGRIPPRIPGGRRDPALDTGLDPARERRDPTNSGGIPAIPPGIPGEIGGILPPFLPGRCFGRPLIMAIIGTLSKDDDDSSESDGKKMNLLSFKLNRVCLDPLNMSKAGDFSWGRILKDFYSGSKR